MLRSLFFIFFAFGSWAQYSATVAHFSPIPINSDKLFRASTGLGFSPTPSTELEGAFLYHPSAGFDLGIGFHGGFADIPICGVVGAELMFRFLKDMTDSFFFGVQTQMGLTYTGLASTTEPEYATAIPVTVTVILGGILQKKMRFYAAPAVELGQTMQGGDVAWKNGIGLKISLGLAVPLKPNFHFVAEIGPKLTQLNAETPFKTLNVDANLGFLFDF